MGAWLVRGVVAIMAAVGLAVALAEAPAADTPQGVYLDFHRTLKRSANMEALRHYYTQARQAEIKRRYPPDLRDQAFTVMRDASPEAVEIVTSSVENGRARLKLRSSDGDASMTGTATLVRENGAWRVEEVTWHRQ